MDLEQKHAEVLALIWFSLFYVIVFPLGIFVTLVGVMWIYIVDKVRAEKETIKFIGISYKSIQNSKESIDCEIYNVFHESSLRFFLGCNSITCCLALRSNIL